MAIAQWKNIDLDAGSKLAAEVLAEHFPGQMITKVPRFPQPGPAGQCYQNVRSAIRAYGGNSQLGWLLTVWPGKFVEAMYHAVWVRRPGDVLDVTERPYPQCRATVSSFIPLVGERLREVDPVVPPVFHRLDDDPATAALLEAAVSITTTQATLADYVRLHRITAGSDRAAQIPPGTPAFVVAGLVELNKQVTRAIDQRDQALIRLT